MTDPRRLREVSGPGRELLLTAHDDRPSDEARQRAMVALGVVGPLLPPPPAGPAAGAAGSAAPGVVAKVIATKIGVGTVLPWALVLAVGGGGVWMVTQHGAPPKEIAPTPEPRAGVVEAAPPVARSPILALPPVPAEPPEPAPPEPAPPEAVPAKTVRRAPPVVPLSREIELLDEARAELKAGRPGGAESALERYRAACPSGRLRPEAALIEIDRLLLLGERDQAAEAARAHRAEHGDVLPPRHRALLGEVP